MGTLQHATIQINLTPETFVIPANKKKNIVSCLAEQPEPGGAGWSRLSCQEGGLVIPTATRKKTRRIGHYQASDFTYFTIYPITEAIMEVIYIPPIGEI
jgi:hypothetical protein